MTTAEKERRLDRLVEVLVEKLAIGQHYGRSIELAHKLSCALVWYRGRGRGAAIRHAMALCNGARQAGL